ncbi:MAG TPA: iron-sulfur cluster assembly scaffold protein [Geminicoccaceae bacterium]|nr:iron-sulfur cluster assembly scaffold protein [Geminicoccaceae bacterium]
MDLGIYSAALLRLAAEATGAGRLAKCDASADILNPTCGDRITVDVGIAEGRIAALGYEVHACVLTQASASLIGRHAVGCSAAEIRAVAERIEAMLRVGSELPVGAWADYAVFAPVRGHKSRHECVMLPLRALLAALAAGGAQDRGS